MPVICLATVVKERALSDDIKEYVLLPEVRVPYEPGQFLQLSLEKTGASEQWGESRTFSVASFSQKTACLRLIIKKMGKYTERIFREMKEGSIVTIKYAFGDFLLPDDEREPLLCLAGGSGITPFLSFLDYLEEINGLDRMKILYSVKTKKEALFYEEIRRKIGENLTLFTTKEKTDIAVPRRISLEDIMKAAERDTHIYICGSEDFNRSLQKNLESAGYQNIHLDEW